MTFPAFPLLSEEDKEETAEGGLDPLGLVQVSDALALRLVPGLRQRMANPRFLTAIAVAATVCGSFPEETVARDRVSPPWQVFEWIMVEALVRTAEGPESFRLPGSEKGRQALQARVPLAAVRYLKNPTVFGFHGVYRGLARDMDIEYEGRLGEVGYRLLQAWAEEQDLIGFLGTASGPGVKVRQQLSAAVQDSLKAGSVDRSDNWPLWDFFRKHLAPDRIGEGEKAVLEAALLNTAAGYRRTVLEHLVSPEGLKSFEEQWSERCFHASLRARADPDLQDLLDAISGYERLSRLCQNAFDAIRVKLTRRPDRKTSLNALGALDAVKTAAVKVPEMFNELLQRLAQYPETHRFSEIFARLGEAADSTEWANALLGHHIAVQRRKPPMPKSPWFEQYDDGGVMIRPLYRWNQPLPEEDRYLHGFRTFALRNFAIDLRLIST